MRSLNRPGRGNITIETVPRGKVRPYKCRFCGFYHMGHDGRVKGMKKPKPKEKKRIEFDE